MCRPPRALTAPVFFLFFLGPGGKGEGVGERRQPKTKKRQTPAFFSFQRRKRGARRPHTKRMGDTDNGGKEEKGARAPLKGAEARAHQRGQAKKTREPFFERKRPGHSVECVAGAGASSAPRDLVDGRAQKVACVAERRGGGGAKGSAASVFCGQTARARAKGRRRQTAQEKKGNKKKECHPAHTHAHTRCHSLIIDLTTRAPRPQPPRAPRRRLRPPAARRAV